MPPAKRACSGTAAVSSAYSSSTSSEWMLATAPGTGNWELGVGREHLQCYPAEWVEAALGCEPGSLEMSAAAPELGPGLSFDLVRIGIWPWKVA